MQRVSERLECVVDLHGQLARRNQDHGARAPRRGRASLRQHRDSGQSEPERLARSRARTGKDIPPGERIGDGRGLNREGGFHSGALERIDQGLGEAEVAEGNRLAGYESTRRRTVPGIAPSAAIAPSVRPAETSVTT